LKVLEDAGLISRGHDTQPRPCHFEAAPLAKIAILVEQYRQLWDNRLDQLEDYLAELQNPKKLVNRKPSIRGHIIMTSNTFIIKYKLHYLRQI
jgi:hypothetical protein